jgi:phosphoribosylanthranilate isomerase
MKIIKMTATGADNSVSPKSLLELSERYPFVEWGILFSKNKENSLRYSSLSWIKDFCEIIKDKKVNTSGHICGSYCRELLLGKENIFLERSFILNAFQRFQLNFNAAFSKIDYLNFPLLLKKYNLRDIIFILQMNSDKSYGVLDVVRKQVKVNVFFDKSGGKGFVPFAWPTLIDGVLCGYAGGLGPNNIEEELKKIENVVGNNEIWIDMESGVRSEDNLTFDLNKVEFCLNAVKKYI